MPTEPQPNDVSDAKVLLLWPLVPMLRERLSDSRGGIKA